MELEEKIQLFLPGPIKLQIDPTRYMVIPRPINVPYTKILSYFKSDPIATLKLAFQLIRENRREEAFQFLKDTYLFSNSYKLDDLTKELQQIFYLLGASMQIGPNLNEQNISVSDQFISAANKISFTPYAETLLGFRNYFIGKDSEKNFNEALKLNRRYSPALVGLAMMQLNRRNVKEGLELLKKA